MNYRCFTCGFVQDFEPTVDNVAIHHPWMAGKPITDCPACTQYLIKYGGRKNGKVAMPDITEVGVIVAETEEVLTEIQKRIADSQKILAGDEQVAQEYGDQKIFGYSVDDLKEIKRRIEEKKTK